MSNRPSSPTPPWWFFLAGTLTACIIFVAGMVSLWGYNRILTYNAAPSQDEMALFGEAWRLIERDFFGALPSPGERAYAALSGSLETLNDPYTYFVEPEPAKREQEELQGRFGGIGAYLELHEDGRIRLTPMVDRPADLAGIEKGDVLVAIDSQNLPIPANIDDARNRLRGPIGSKVSLKILRVEKALEFQVTREEIELPSVTWRAIEDAPNVGYIRIERFSSLTDHELSEALSELRKVDADDNLVLDLRGNPGGLLDAAIAVTSQFVADGPILIERSSDASEKTYNAEPRSDVSHPQMVILVDQGTASAAEIVAGALRDRLGVKLVGQLTYGKGSIQRIHRLSDGSALHVTFARWYTPNGHEINGKGLTPDIDASAASTAETDASDPALLTALQQLLPDAAVLP